MSELHGNPIVVMGVQGCGKSTVGTLIAQRLGYVFVDGDDLHSPEAKAKMTSGIPLNDHDRAPWLERVARTIKQREEAGETLVVACSALKRKYRDWMREIVPHLVFVHLSGDQELIAERLTRRNHAFMPATLLNSQYEALEELGSDEEGIVVDIMISPDTVVEQVLSELSHNEAILTGA